MNMTMRRHARATFRNLTLTGIALAMAAAGCDCGDGNQISRLAPQISLYDPTVPEDMREELGDLGFGRVPLGATKTIYVGVANKGSDRLRVCIEGTTIPTCTELSRVQPEGSPFVPSFDNPAEDNGAWLVEKGSDREFRIDFTPVTEGEFNASLIITHNALAGSTTLNLSGTGIAPQVTFSREAIDFGQVTVNTRAEVQLTMTNGTEFAQPVSVSPMAQASVIFGTTTIDNQETPFDQPFTGSIPGNGMLTIKVFYQPPEEGTHTNALDVSYCATCNKMIALSGEGVKPLFELVPGALDFGSVEEGTPVTRSFVVRNVGNYNFEVMAIGLERGTTMEYTPTPAQAVPVTLAPAAELSVDVTYVGTSPGEDLGRIEVVTNACSDPTAMVCDSTGFVSLQAVSNGPDINAFPPIVNFGTVAIEGTSARTLSIQNTGNTALTVSGINLVNATSGEISVTGGMPGSFPTSIAAGASIELTLGYNPTDPGPDRAEIEILSDDRDEAMLTVPVMGVGGVPTTCSINVAPSQLTFGLVERGRVATLPVEIRNAGAMPCLVSNIRLSGAAEFSVATGTGGGQVTVASGSSHRLEISYAPTDYGFHNTLLEFDSDDPSQGMVQVPVSGGSQQTNVLVVPSSIDFSVVPVTCRSPARTVTVYNTGSSVITINNVYLDPTTSPEFELSPFATPAQLPAGGSVTISLRYHPADIGQDTGVLFIAHSDSMFPVAVPLQGEGQINPTVTDTFQQLPTPRADVLFVVDNSCSMSQEQSSLGSNLGAFLSFAQQQGIDYQIAVTTTDVSSGGEAGQFVGTTRIITPSTPNANTVFQQNTALGTSGSGTERGLEAAYLALSDPLINTLNAGFLRIDAALAVIFVSDERDQSSRTQAFYEDFLRNIKGFTNTAMFSASAVVGIQSPSCNGPGGNAEYAPRYINVANNTGGVVESICAANWGQTLANIGLNSFGLRRQFSLSSSPVPVTIAVTVDGNPIPGTTAGGQQNWNYDSSTNTIIFSAAAVPPAGATITVTYTVACLP